MTVCIRISSWLVAGLVAALLLSPSAEACCPAPPPGVTVLNADQSVVIVWDAETKTQHFIRRASFKSEADNFGFLVPSPTQPELNESGDAAFGHLSEVTAPEIVEKKRPSEGIGCGCAARYAGAPGLSREAAPLRVLEEKRVAGFHASVIETKSATALVDWLRKNGYDYSPAVETWAKPYVESGWKITALKVAKSKEDAEKTDVAAKALRMSFRTDRPLFPYTEPDYKDAVKKLEAGKRLLRIFFVADGRYRGKLEADADWTGKVAWAGKLSAENRGKLLDLLGLPEKTGSAVMWLTEFEDFWPYKPAAGDLAFSRDPEQKTLKRPPTIRYVRGEIPDAAACAFAAVLLLTPLMRIVRGRREGRAAIGEHLAR